MRIESVQVVAFGPFANCMLEFAPGFTIVHGPNESGKSTWHAATYAALCGMRRARGPRQSDDQKFTDRHRPWDVSRWLVIGVVTLEDGRRIELRQNLDDRVDCTATDLVVGANVSAEIIGEGSPDASIWLGMDRHTFLATGCIRQADVLSIRESAEALQEHLQRAASTAGVDATAAKALESLDEFQRERIGRDMANSTKPLRKARERLEHAEKALQLARSEHTELLNRSRLADDEGEKAAEAAGSRRLFDAALAADRAKSATVALKRATELSNRYANKQVVDLSSDDALAQRAASALQAFSRRPEPIVLDGPTVEQIARELELLPSMPDADTRPDDTVVKAKAAWDGVAHGLSVHDTQRPAQPDELAVGENADGLRQLAFQLQRERQQPEARAGRGSFRLGSAMAALGAIMLVGGISVGVSGNAPAGAVVAAAAVLLAIVGSVLAIRGRTQAAGTLPSPDAEPRGPAAAHATSLGLPTDPTQLLAVADRVENAERQRALISSWLKGREELTTQWRNAVQALKHALEARSAIVDGNPKEAFATYVADCDRRAEQASAASRRSDIQKQLEQRLLLEQNAHAAAKQREEAESELRSVGMACGVGDGTLDAIEAGIGSWLMQKDEKLQASTVELQERAELQSILGTGTLHDLGLYAERLQGDADNLASGFSQAEVSAVELGANPENHLRELETAERGAADAAQRAHGEIEELKVRIHDVPAAEEEKAAAEALLSEIRDLEQTLNLTKQYLGAAQERVHRDIAPLLASTLNSWLPRVTYGRYQQALVDPQTLAVKIRCVEGRWRDAGLVSDGTREQVYLLLRMALAQRLTRKGEVAPLLLDEVTVQSDAHRTEAILNLLREMSSQVQVILFSQEDEVRSWAETNLSGPRDRLELLELSAVPG